jgi:hypothetical protein
MDLDCLVAKTIKAVSNSTLASGCPYVHPYLQVSINGHLEVTLLADDESIPEKYSFEMISNPGNLTVTNIMIKLGSYFATNFDILTNLDAQRDLNDGVREVNTVLLDWTQAFPQPTQLQHNPHTANVLSC